MKLLNKLSLQLRKFELWTLLNILTPKLMNKKQVDRVHELQAIIRL